MADQDRDVFVVRRLAQQLAGASQVALAEGRALTVLAPLGEVLGRDVDVAGRSAQLSRMRQARGRALRALED